MEDATEEALQRIREELARRGLTLVTPKRAPGERAAESGSAGRAQLWPARTPARSYEQVHIAAHGPVSRPWLRYTLLGFGLLAILPWLAPVFAAVGWWGAADPIYTLYMFLCHQLPERAATLFGYQVAFCWRNAALYGGMFVFGLLYAWSTRYRTGPDDLHREPSAGLLRRRTGARPRAPRRPKAIPLWVYVLTLLPMALDGFSHMFGLRDGVFPDSGFGSFLVGSQFLSLNWWLRVSTGLLAAFGSVWFTFPRLDRYIALTRGSQGARTQSVQPVPSPPGLPELLGSRLAPAHASPLVDIGSGENGDTNE